MQVLQRRLRDVFTAPLPGEQLAEEEEGRQQQGSREGNWPSRDDSEEVALPRLSGAPPALVFTRTFGADRCLSPSRRNHKTDLVHELLFVTANGGRAGSNEFHYYTD